MCTLRVTDSNARPLVCGTEIQRPLYIRRLRRRGVEPNCMARVALPCLVLIHILLAVALVSMPPGPTRTRLQCPGCSKAFGSETGLRQHRAALGRKGGPAAGSCAFDTRLPIESGWSGRGQRAAGMVQNMSRAAARLAGLDSSSDSDGSNSAVQGGRGGQAPPVPIPPPADSDSDVPGPPDDPPSPAGGPAAPPVMPQVHRCIHIRTHTCKICAEYIQIHTDAGTYDK